MHIPRPGPSITRGEAVHGVVIRTDSKFLLSSIIIGVSTYVPSWIKTDQKRFPRAKLRKAGGVLQTTEVVSLFHSEARKADVKAFTRLMAHLKEVDEAHSTVLMVQVENEPGLLGDSRDGSAAAERLFGQPVPADLLDFLEKDWDKLHPDFNFRTNGPFKVPEPRGSASWEAVFGKGPKTDELFMAYHYAHYVNEVAAAGKAAYPLPLYANVWQNYFESDDGGRPGMPVGGGEMPGDYPSGGATSNVLDIWLQFAPALDLIAPDIYLNDYDATCRKYCHRGQPLFVPEQRRDAYGARRIWVALGSYGAIGTSPFGIDTLVPLAESPFAKQYKLLHSVSELVLEAQRNPGCSLGFCFDELPDGPGGSSSSSSSGGAFDVQAPDKPIVRRWGRYELTIERCFVFGRPGPAAGMVIHRGEGRFLLIGWGFQVRARDTTPGTAFTGILLFHEKVPEEGGRRLRTLRQLNGDETRGGAFVMMPAENPDYGDFPICVTIPARTMVAELEVYSLSEDGDGRQVGHSKTGYLSS